MFYIGIDPGINSGITILDDNGKYINSFAIPTIINKNKKKEIDVVKLYDLLIDYKEKCSIIIELVHAISGQGIVSLILIW